MAIGFLGAGKMAEALLSSMVQDELCEPWEIVVCDISEERRNWMAEQYEVAVTDDAAEVVEDCDMLVVAVKPQDINVLLTGIKDQLDEEHLVISIAAGKTLAALQGVIGTKPRLVRVMPNLALSVGEGMSVFCAAENVTPDDKEAVMQLLGMAGAVLELPEQHFDAVTALSGSGPAFVAYVLQAMIKAAVALDLPEEEAPVGGADADRYRRPPAEHGERHRRIHPSSRFAKGHDRSGPGGAGGVGCEYGHQPNTGRRRRAQP